MTAVFSEEPRAPPAQIEITLPLGRKSPAAGGAEAHTASGGVSASIAQMYILRACRGKSPPLCRLQAEDLRPTGRERSVRTRSGILRQRELREGLVSHAVAVTGKKNAIG